MALLPELRQAPLLVIGGGSNLLFTQDFDGNVLHPQMSGIEMRREDDESVLLRCGAGEVWDDVVAYAVEHGYYGMENLSLIPGEVGASAVQNIGAYGAEAKDVIYAIEAIDIATGEGRIFFNDDCAYGYRESKFKSEWKGKYVITYVTYRLSKTFIPHLDYGNLRTVLAEKGITTPTAAEVRQAVIEIRESKLPDVKVEGNAGSFFKNPVVSREKYEALLTDYPNMPHYNVDEEHEKIPAGWMIDQCGWKGQTLGRAGVHSKQALVLVNKGGATGSEIVALCEAVRKDVYDKFGVHISPEVNII